MGRRTKRSLRIIVGQNIRSLRVAAGRTQEDLADRAGVSPVYLSRIETGQANCTLDVLEATADALGVSAIELLSPT